MNLIKKLKIQISEDDLRYPMIVLKIHDQNWKFHEIEISQFRKQAYVFVFDESRFLLEDVKLKKVIERSEDYLSESSRFKDFVNDNIFMIQNPLHV